MTRRRPLKTDVSDGAALIWPGPFNDNAATQLVHLTARVYPYALPKYLTATGLNVSAGIYSPFSNVNLTDSDLVINTSSDAKLDSSVSYISLSGSS